MSCFLILFSFLTTFTFAGEPLLKETNFQYPKSLGGEKTVHEIMSALTSEQPYSAEYSEKNEKPSFNGLKFNYIKIGSGSLLSIRLDEKSKIGKFVLPKDTSIGFLGKGDKRIVSYFQLKRNSEEWMTYDGHILSQETGVSIKDGFYMPVSFSGKEQKVNGIQLYKNQPIAFDVDGSLKKIDYILHYGQKYYFKDIQKNGEVSIRPFNSYSNDYGSILKFLTSSVGYEEFLGNVCRNCTYKLCLNGDHFYVHYIDVKGSKSKIHGESVNRKIGAHYYYRDGNSKKPFIDQHNGLIPLEVDCTFIPSSDLSPERAESLKNY